MLCRGVDRENVYEMKLIVETRRPKYLVGPKDDVNFIFLRNKVQWP